MFNPFTEIVCILLYIVTRCKYTSIKWGGGNHKIQMNIIKLEFEFVVEKAFMIIFKSYAQKFFRNISD